MGAPDRVNGQTIQLISRKLIRGGAAVLAVAALVAGCGSSSPDSSSSTTATQPPRVSAEKSPSPATKGASGERGGKSAANAKAKPLKLAAAGGRPGKETLVKITKGETARRILKELTSARGGQRDPGEARVRKAISRILSQGEGQGGPGPSPKKQVTVPDVVQEILSQVGNK